MITFCWVVTHRDEHDDCESLERAVHDMSRSASAAWKCFMKLAGDRVSRKVWYNRGYVARRVEVHAFFARNYPLDM